MKKAGLVLALLLPALALADDFTVELEKKPDGARVEAGPDSARVLVTSASGIGGVTVTPKTGWPKSVTIQLAYAGGKPFRNLEGFGLKTPALTASGGIRQSGRLAFAFTSGSAPHGVEEDARTTGGLLNVTMAHTPQGILITLPPHLLTGRQPLHVGWIDAFR